MTSEELREKPKLRRGRPKKQVPPRAPRMKADYFSMKLPKDIIPNGINVLMAKNKTELRERWGLNVPEDINWTGSYYERVGAILETIGRLERPMREGGEIQ